MYEELTDEQLISLVGKKDKDAFNLLYSRYEIAIYSYLKKLIFDPNIVEEIFQEVFIRVYTKASTFKQKYTFKSWIYKVSMNLYIDYYKKLKKNKSFLGGNSEDLENVKYDAPNFLDDLVEREKFEYINKIIKSLPEKYRQAIVLKKLQDLTFDQVADIMGVTSRSVKTYVAKGLQMLKKQFDLYDKS